MTKKLFALAGFGEDRLNLEWVSSAEAGRFVEVVSETVETVRQAGKFDPEANRMALDAAEMTVNGEIVRWIVGKEIKTTTKGDVYGRKWDTDTFDMIIDSVLEREYQKNLILQAIKAGHTSPRAIHAAIGLDLQRISYLLADMEKTNMVEFRGMTDRIPEFAAL